jgi:MFS family permease
VADTKAATQPGSGGAGAERSRGRPGPRATAEERTGRPARADDRDAPRDARQHDRRHCHADHRRELGGLEHLSWVVTAYTLATAASTPIWGKLGDMYGRKGVFMTSIVLFLIGSALSGMAQDMGQLIGFRAIQGLGAGGLMVGVMAIIGDLIPPRERGKYQGMMAGVMALAMIGGPLVGGTITDNWGWRWSFYINLPLGVVALIAISAVLHLPRKRAQARIDYLGAGLLTVGITSIVLVTTWGGTSTPGAPP